MVCNQPTEARRPSFKQALTMWLYLAALLGLYFLCRWYQERQTVENLREKYVFITGCDSGFGNQLARQLDLQGLCVLAACHTQKGAEQLEKATSERLKITILDVTSTESVAAATEWVKSCEGKKGLWGLVNNAGIAVPVMSQPMADEGRLCKSDVTLLGTINVTLHLLPLVRQANGRVVNMASVLGRLAGIGGGYPPSKYGVEAFSDSLRCELLPFRVQVSIIEPGAFITPGVQKIEEDFNTLWSWVPSDIREIYGQQYFDNFGKLSQCTLKAGDKDLHLVTDCIEHTLTSCYPRTRYSAGWDAKLFYIPVSCLPTVMADYVLTRSGIKPAQAV